MITELKHKEELENEDLLNADLKIEKVEFKLQNKSIKQKINIKRHGNKRIDQEGKPSKFGFFAKRGNQDK